MAAGTWAQLLTGTAPKVRWPLDFAHDPFARARRFRIFTVTDDATKEYLAARGRYRDLGPPRCAGPRGAHRAGLGKPDLWHRDHLERDAGLERGDERGLALHRARQAYARHGIYKAFTSRMRDDLLNETLAFGPEHARRPRCRPDWPTATPPDPIRRPATRPPRPMPSNAPDRASGQFSTAGSGFSRIKVTRQGRSSQVFL